MKRVLLIDDEQDGRVLIRQYLTDFPQFTIIGEADNGLTAVELINARQPDLVFLDIEMPGLNGFEVLTRLQSLPKIIFSTSYDQYAIRAFELYAVDYLLKPYGKARFANALSRLDKPHHSVEPLAEHLLGANKPFPEKIIVHKGRRNLLIPVASITYCEAFGDYTRVYHKQEAFVATSGISHIQTKLDPVLFKRIHRSYLVNWDRVEELQKKGRYYYLLSPDFPPLKIGESYLPEIQSLRL